VIGGRGTTVPGKSEIWIRNLYDPLVALGHQVTLLDIDAFAEQHGVGYMSPEAKELLSNELPMLFEREHATQKFDIFFSYLHERQIYPDVLRQIKQKVYTINYTTNYHQFEVYKEIAQIVDLNIAIYRGASEGFDQIGAKMYWMPFAGNPGFYRPGPQDPAKVAVFVGSNYGHRPHYLWRTLQHGINLHIYGSGWQTTESKVSGSEYTTPKRPWWRHTIKELLNSAGFIIIRANRTNERELDGQQHYFEAELRSLDANLMQTIVKKINHDYPHQIHGPLSDIDFASRLSSASICVNISESHIDHDFVNPQVLFGYGLRDFEATLSGTFVCTQYYNDLDCFFDIGREIEVFYNAYDLADKLKYYLHHDSEREAIAHAGYERAVKDHTWQRRFEDFFNALQI